MMSWFGIAQNVKPQSANHKLATAGHALFEGQWTEFLLGSVRGADCASVKVFRRRPFADGVAERRLQDAELSCRLGEAALAPDRQERHQVV
jgi:hypothetical protein